ncbi:MAG: 16S rRNA (cytidine(1402)-2'-O)-methyltransferase [Pseudomonadales bacterium]
MPGIIYVVATPIGNLEDITWRAVNVLRSVEIVAAEDTRHTRTLLAHLQIAPPRLVSLHEHNEQGRSAALVAEVAAGRSLALVSDAGTPLINDPGLEVVRAAWDAGIRVVPIPGPSSVLGALSVSPFGSANALLAGFLPVRDKVREEALLRLCRHPGAVVFFEAPHRIVGTLETLERIAPARRILVCRELTKLHETLLLGLASELKTVVREEHRGEFTCVLEGAGSDGDADSVARLELGDRLIAELKGLLPPRQAARIVAKVCGLRAREVYARLTGEGASETEE